MLSHPTLDKLHELKLTGMVQALSEQMQMPEINELSFEERLGLLVDRELTERDQRRLKNRLQRAKLRQSACIEDLDYRHPRGLDKSLMTRLAQGQWIREHLNVLITLVPPASAKRGWRVPWPNRPAVRASARSICACRGFFRTSPLPKPMGATANS
jgi:IstB-like ATP binding protein